MEPQGSASGPAASCDRDGAKEDVRTPKASMSCQSPRAHNVPSFSERSTGSTRTPSLLSSVSSDGSPVARWPAGSSPPSSAGKVESCCASFVDDDPRKRSLLRELAGATDEEAQQVGLPPAPPLPLGPAPPPLCRAGFFIVVPTFMAYAALFSLQGEVKAAFRITDSDRDASHMFSFMTSFLGVFNFIFRFVNNIVFGCFPSRTRVHIAMGSLLLSMVILVSMTAEFLRPSFFLLFSAYALGGIGIGSFEPNLLSSLTFLGHATKKYATIGVPVGICLTQIGGFAALQSGLNVQSIYVTVMACLLGGMAVLRFAVPAPPPDLADPPNGRNAIGESSKFRLAADLRAWREWLPHMWTLPLAMALDMFCLTSFAPGVLLFVYDKPEVVLLGSPIVKTPITVSKDIFFVLYNTCTALGGFTGRLSAYHLRRLVHPVWFAALSATGVLLNVLSMPGHALAFVAGPTALLAGSLILLGDGLIYNMISRTIDERVPKSRNLSAISCWLFVGDVGSIAGMNLIPFIHDWVV